MYMQHCTWYYKQSMTLIYLPGTEGRRQIGDCNCTWDILQYEHSLSVCHDDIIEWKHFLCYWPLVGGIHQSLMMNSPLKGLCHGALLFFICAWMNSWANNRDALIGRHQTITWTNIDSSSCYKVPWHTSEHIVITIFIFIDTNQHNKNASRSSKDLRVNVVTM